MPVDKMIAVTNIDYVELDRDTYEFLPHGLMTDSDVPVMDSKGQHDCMKASVVHELIRGIRYVRPGDGTELLIGHSEQARDLLGMPMEAWETAMTERDEARLDLITARQIIGGLDQSIHSFLQERKNMYFISKRMVKNIVWGLFPFAIIAFALWLLDIIPNSLYP